MTCRVEIVGRSDRGLVREANEDAILAADLDAGTVLDLSQSAVLDGERGPLLVLCDGMGGNAGGATASALACHSIFEATHSCPATTDRAVLARNLRRAVRLANQDVAAAALANKELQGMGTTVSAAALVDNTAVLAQVGDSRVYVLRGQRLSQITRDQSVVAAMVQSGQLSEDRAAYSMQRGRILQAVGSSEDVEVSLSIAELRSGDRILMCSDGLHEYVAHDAMRVSCGLDSIEESVRKLLSLALAAGGADNISVLIAEVTGPPLGEPVTGEDEVRFTELDPSLEGESALSTTSYVGRRLAHKAGLRKDAWPRALPATSQHPAVPEGAALAGPAERALAKQGRVGPWAWALIAGALIVGIALVVGLW